MTVRSITLLEHSIVHRQCGFPDINDCALTLPIEGIAVSDNCGGLVKRQTQTWIICSHPMGFKVEIGVLFHLDVV